MSNIQAPLFHLSKVKFKNILDIEELAIAEGKVTCLIGQSGSGKTTLLKLLNKMISPDSGSVKLHGKDLEDLDSIALRREVVMLSQNPAIYPGSLRDNLLIALRFAEQKEVADKKLREVLTYFELDKSLDDTVENMSGGEKQRLALARLSLLDAKVILLDEPSSALDDGTEKAVMERLVSFVREEGKSLIIVTHSKPLVEYIADDMIEIYEGRVI